MYPTAKTCHKKEIRTNFRTIQADICLDQRHTILNDKMIRSSSADTPAEIEDDYDIMMASSPGARVMDHLQKQTGDYINLLSPSNLETDEQDLKDRGREFQSVGAAKEKDRPP
ncbi:hypothetical protein GQR58_014756 [Nymphon striatum]|nr:hypothetical protein GQR58_014756 [Nymphon striatum]